jgi:hypothetical protein
LHIKISWCEEKAVVACKQEIPVLVLTIRFFSKSVASEKSIKIKWDAIS